MFNTKSDCKMKQETNNRPEPISIDELNNFDEVGLTDLPERTSRYDDNYDRHGMEPCPRCGREMKSERYMIPTVWGGSMFKAEFRHLIEQDIITDGWFMFVGSECVKHFPKEYVIDNGAK